MDEQLQQLKTLLQIIGNPQPLRSYCAKIGIPYDQDCLEAIRIASYADLPYQLPSTDEYKRLANGDFNLGSIGRNNETLNLNLKEDLPLGVMITGGTGMGKTTLLSNIAFQLGQINNVGCWLFNIREEVNSGLPNFTSIKMSEILPNLFERKPYLKPEFQAHNIADIVASTFLLLWSKSLIFKVLFSFYIENKSPTLKEVRDKIADSKSGKSSGLTNQQLSKLVGVFDYLILSFGREQHLRKGFQPPEHWNKKYTIINDVGKGDIQALLITYLLDSLYQHNIHHGYRGKLRTTFLVDESKYLLSLERERISANYGAPVLDTIISQQRSAGLALVAATQTAFPKIYASNTATKILMRTGDARYFQLTAKSMGLTQKQQEFALLNCKVGDAVITTNKFNRPLLVALHDLAFKPNNATVNHSTDGFKQDYLYANPSRNKAPVKTEFVPGSGALLKYYSQNPLSPFTTAIKELKLNRESAIKAASFLTENNYTKKEQVRLFIGRGRQPVIYELTTKGKDWLKYNHPEIKPIKLNGKGSLEHRAHQYLVKEAFKRRGCDVQVETHEADLVIKKPEDNSFVTIEIANQNSRNLEQRIQANKEAGAMKTVVICSTNKFFQKAKKQLQFFNQVEVQSIEEYLWERQ